MMLRLPGAIIKFVHGSGICAIVPCGLLGFDQVYYDESLIISDSLFTGKSLLHGSLHCKNKVCIPHQLVYHMTLRSVNYSNYSVIIALRGAI